MLIHWLTEACFFLYSTFHQHIFDTQCVFINYCSFLSLHSNKTKKIREQERDRDRERWGRNGETEERKRIKTLWNQQLKQGTALLWDAETLIGDSNSCSYRWSFYNLGRKMLWISKSVMVPDVQCPLALCLVRNSHQLLLNRTRGYNPNIQRNNFFFSGPKSSMYNQLLIYFKNQS